MRKGLKSVLAVITILSGLSLAPGLSALEPPERDAQAISRDRSAATGLEPGNHLVSPGLVAAFKARLSREKGLKSPPPAWSGGLPAQGSPKVLVLLIEFEEYPHKPADTVEAMRAKIFGAGGRPPYESLSAYYRRSSYGKLNIGGEVLGWYNAGRRSEVAQDNAGREELIKKAILNYPDHDFSQYDNDGDGKVDYFAVVWTGPHGDWATFWWGMKTVFADRGFTAGGKQLGAYSWQGEANKWEDPAAEFWPRTLIHETGHALGLPDYYDYKPGAGPDGGVGEFDMMHANRFDHNCFSKFLLGWTEPRVVSAGEFRLRPASEAPDCVLLAPPGWESDPFSEFFLVENRRATGNDADKKFPGGGLVIWHVDARLNERGTNFLYNNQTTEHKLLRLLEADGLEEIETLPNHAFGQDDFYSEGRTLGPETVPSSGLYDGTATGFSLRSLGGADEAAFSVWRGGGLAEQVKRFP